VLAAEQLGTLVELPIGAHHRIVGKGGVVERTNVHERRG
jgi:hypothetical protein